MIGPGRRRTTDNGSALAAAIDGHDPDLILVDYFETLVTRSITGKVVKQVVARWLAETLGRPELADVIHQARLDAEDLVGEESKLAGGDDEYRLDEALVAMWRQLGPEGSGPLDIDRETFLDRAIEIELAVERLAQQRDDSVVNALRTGGTGRTLVVVSDFHLPSELFFEMLDWHDLDDLFDHVYVSCDTRRSKATGRLYDHVVASLPKAVVPADPERVLMVGDHPLSDGRRAREHGFVTHQINRRKPPRPHRIRRRWRDSEPERRRAVRQAIDVTSPSPFAELAVSLYVFTARLHDRARAAGVEQLVFLAREGQFLQTLYDRYRVLSPAAAGSAIESRYLVVSRRSTLLAGLAPIDQEDFSTLVSKYPDLSLADVIGSLGFGPEVADDLAADLGVDRDRPIDLDQLRGHAGFRDRYEARRTEQRDLLGCYVAETTGRHDGPLDVVDVGWKGSIQDHLQAALAPDRPVRGWYLGVVADESVADPTTKNGVLFDSRRPTTPAYRVLRHFKALYEYLLQAEHGSAAGYRRKPVADGNRRQASPVVPVLDTQDEETELYADYIGPVQAGVLAVFEELCRLDGLRPVPLVDGDADAAWFHARMLYLPHRAEVQLVRSLRHYENFGPMGFVDADETDAVITSSRWRTIAAVARRPRRLLSQSWPPATLDALGLGPLIPVVGLYRLGRELGMPAVHAVIRRAER